MKALAIGTIELTDENKNYYDRRGYHMTGETLTLGFEGPDGSIRESVEYIVFKGSWTQYETVRDCGDHYIKAQYSRYDRIDKATLAVTYDVEDR